jgi:hypothetical protein
LKDNPFLQDGSGEFTIVDESGNIIAKIDKDGIHTIEVTAGEHILSNKVDKKTLDDYATKSDLTFDNITDNPLVENKSGDLTIIDSKGNIGLMLNSDGIAVKDVTAGNHVLSNKADKSEIPSLTGYAT